MKEGIMRKIIIFPALPSSTRHLPLAIVETKRLRWMELWNYIIG